MVPVPCALTAPTSPGSMPARASAALIAWISPRLSRAGAVMWTASLEAPQPSSSPTGSRPSPRARSGDASSSAAAPSPRVSPERPRSNGMQGPVRERLERREPREDELGNRVERDDQDRGRRAGGDDLGAPPERDAPRGAGGADREPGGGQPEPPPQRRTEGRQRDVVGGRRQAPGDALQAVDPALGGRGDQQRVGGERRQVRAQPVEQDGDQAPGPRELSPGTHAARCVL